MPWGLCTLHVTAAEGLPSTGNATPIFWQKAKMLCFSASEDGASRSSDMRLTPFADGSAHGVLVWSSNGMDAVVTEEYVSFRVTGGILDLYFFMGPTPMEVLEQ